jgi:hypothetical protein
MASELELVYDSDIDLYVPRDFTDRSTALHENPACFIPTPLVRSVSDSQPSPDNFNVLPFRTWSWRPQPSTPLSMGCSTCATVITALNLCCRCSEQHYVFCQTCGRWFKPLETACSCPRLVFGGSIEMNPGVLSPGPLEWKHPFSGVVTELKMDMVVPTAE